MLERETRGGLGLYVLNFRHFIQGTSSLVSVGLSSFTRVKRDATHVKAFDTKRDA